VLLEVIPSWQDAIRRLRSRYPHRTPDRWWGGTSTVVWSRHPLRPGPGELRRRAGGSVLDVTLEIEGRPLRLLALHAPRPRTAASLRRRNAIFRDLARWTRERAVPTVLAGDFNATPWTPALHRLVEGAGLLRSGPPWGWYASWPAALGNFGIPIDQLLHGEGVTVEAFDLLAIPGSDHRALAVRLALP
jgi:endonuclease/exonuclease/phosphatase (EEP) superfamily protein YafD